MDKEISSKCSKHNEKLKYYCYNSGCQCLICVLCLEDNHRSHTISHISQHTKRLSSESEQTLRTFLEQDSAVLREIKLFYVKTQSLIEEGKNHMWKRFKDLIENLMMDWGNFSNKQASALSKEYKEFLSAHNVQIEKMRAKIKNMQNPQFVPIEFQGEKFEVCGGSVSELTGFATEEYYSGIKEKLAKICNFFNKNFNFILKSEENLSIISIQLHFV